MEKSESIKNLVTALIKAQSEIKLVEKSANNPFFKSKYADLPAIDREYKRVLPKHGLVVNQLIEGLSLITVLAHESGEYMMSAATLNPVKNDPQGLGSAITYMRRYALAAICGIVSSEDDDDGNHASAGHKEEPKAAPHYTPKPIEEDGGQSLTERLSEIKPTKSASFFQLVFANGVKMGCSLAVATLAKKALESGNKCIVEYGKNDKGYLTCNTFTEQFPDDGPGVPF